MPVYRSFYTRILLLFCHACLFSQFTHAQKQSVLNSTDIWQAIQKLKVKGAVLYIAAHPDDENTRLLTYYSKEKLYRTAYLSLTHGEGGQNLIGDEQGKALGLIRTEELMAARRIDGAEQFFTTAEDFGYSKSMEETLKKWDKETVLEQMVRVIRSFRPDIIITRFPPDKRAGHGHHAASAQLAAEAFDLAADATRFPHHAKAGLLPWRARALYWNTYNFGSANTISSGQIRLDVGGYDPLSGKSFGEIAAESRSQHKSQGFGSAAQRGTQWEYFIGLKGDSALLQQPPLLFPDEKPEHKRFTKQIDQIIASYKFTDPSASIPALIRLAQTAASKKEWSHHLKNIEQLLVHAAGIYAEATTDQEYITENDSLSVQTLIVNRSAIPVQLLSVQCMPVQKDTICNDFALSYNIVHKHRFSFPAPAADPHDPSHSLSVIFRIQIQDRVISLVRPVQYKFTDPVKGETVWPLSFYPAITLKPLQDVHLIREDTGMIGLPFRIRSYVRHAPSDRTLVLMARTAQGDTVLRTFPSDTLFREEGLITVQIPAARMLGNPSFFIRWNERVFDSSLERIRHDHIPAVTCLEKVQLYAPRIDYAIAGKKIGYIKGAGDRVDEALRIMGYQVTYLNKDDIVAEQLMQYDAIVTGIRAYNQHDWLSDKHHAFMKYMEKGGVMLMQYNTSSMVGPLKNDRWLFPFSISRNRVSEEDAQVDFLQPEHPVLNHPNTISHSDFAGWIQERSVYEADMPASNCTQILSMHDKDEPERKGSLIVAAIGKGRLIYAGLSFFRQLPAGVPGAYRLMANLLAPPVQP